MKLLAGIKEVKKVKVNPGDVIVIKCDKNIPEQSYETMGRGLKAMFPNNKVIVLADGITLSVKVIDNSHHAFCARLYEAIRDKVMATHDQPLTEIDKGEAQESINRYIDELVAKQLRNLDIS